MANIKDIALEANVSVSTVSRVLNNHPHVSAETKAIVNEVIAKNNYFVNSNAVKLSTGKTMIIGVVVPQVNHACCDGILQSILDAAEADNYNIMILNSDSSEKKEVAFLNMLKHKEVDGLIFVLKAVSKKILASYACWGPIAICQRIEIEGVRRAYPCRLESYYEIFKFFKSVSASHIYVTIPNEKEHSQSEDEKKNVFSEIIGNNINESFYDVANSYEDGVTFAQKIFAELNKDSVPAFYVQLDEIALAIIDEANKCNLVLDVDYFVISEGKGMLSKRYGFKSVDYHLDQVGSYLFESLFCDDSYCHAVEYSW